MSTATTTQLALVRSEIKTWERSFRAEWGRDPVRDDIKARPEMTAKYKLYKSLSKSVSLSTSTSTSTPLTGSMMGRSSSSSIMTTPVLLDDQANPFLESGGGGDSRSRGGSRGRSQGGGVVSAGDEGFGSEFGYKSKSRTNLVSTSTRRKQLETTLTTTATPTRITTRTNQGPYGPIKLDSNHFDPFASPSKGSSGMSGGGGGGGGGGGVGLGSPSSSTARGRTGGGLDPGEEGGRSRPSGFIFAPSPSRLKSLLQGNSIARSPRRAASQVGSTTASSSSPPALRITPRSKARKRLRGEQVEETPKSSSVKRPGGRVGGSAFKGWLSEDEVEEDEDDEVLGPTPRKEAGLGRPKAFKVLFGGEDESEDESGMKVNSEVDRTTLGSGRRKMGGRNGGGGLAGGTDEGIGKMFKRRKIENVPPPRSASGTGQDEPLMMMTPRKGTIASAPPMTGPSGSTPLKGKKLAFLARLEMENDENGVHASEDVSLPDTLERSPETHGRIRVEEDLVREIEWSDSDPDPDPDAPINGDGEPGGMDVDTRLPKRRMMKVKIEPYRLHQQRRLAAAGGAIQARDLRSGGRQFVRTESTKSLDGKRKDGDVVIDVGQDTTLDDGDDATNDDHAHNFSRLSLRSPENDVLRKTMAFHERKAMAIFSSKAANDLRLRRKGIEIYAAGEGFDGDQNEDDLDPYGHERELDAGDDDWDSEPDGWKGVGLGVDDDW